VGVKLDLPCCAGVCTLFIVTLILFRVDVTSNVHLLDFNKRIVCICVFCPFLISYFQDGLKTIEHFGSYVADLSIKLQKIRQKQDEERRRLTELRTLLRSAPGLDKEVSRHRSQQSMYSHCIYQFFSLFSPPELDKKVSYLF
jgi:cell shape-determining protein MreC